MNAGHPRWTEFHRRKKKDGLNFMVALSTTQSGRLRDYDYFAEGSQWLVGYEANWRKDITEKVRKAGYSVVEDCEEYKYIVLGIGERTPLFDLRKMRAWVGVRYVEPNYRIPRAALARREEVGEVIEDRELSPPADFLKNFGKWLSSQQGVLTFSAGLNGQGQKCIRIVTYGMTEESKKIIEDTLNNQYMAGGKMGRIPVLWQASAWPEFVCP